MLDSMSSALAVAEMPVTGRPASRRKATVRQGRIDGGPATRVNPPVAAGTQRVLVVDDNPVARRAIARILEAQGVHVIEAHDGPSALAAGRALAPDLVLLDVDMPGCDGYEVCRQMKCDAASALTPVVMVSGYDTIEDRVKGAEAGADDFFTKPFEAAELMARVRHGLHQKHITDGLEEVESVLYTMARIIEARDADTQGHCSRLSDLGERLGRRIGLSAADCLALRRAGVVHDIGKVVVPDAVLLKAGPLTDDEWRVMREHAAAGERICAPLKTFDAVLPIIRHHHERMDGSGYPDGLAGDAIPITARVLQIVDVYDALTMNRPYKKKLTPRLALSVMEDEVRRGWWDPMVFAAFTSMVMEECDGARTVG